MLNSIFTFPIPFVKNSKKPIVAIFLVDASDFTYWIEKQDDNLKYQVIQAGFEAKQGQIISIVDDIGKPRMILYGMGQPIFSLETAALTSYIQNHYSKDFINDNVFEITSTHEEDVANKISLGWGLGAYRYDVYKKDDRAFPVMIWPKSADQKYVSASLEAIYLLRNLINTPPNILGTDALADAAKEVAKTHKAKIKIIRGEDLLKKNFPLIYNVGQASPRPPQLVDITWGKSSHPKVTIVGKGIVYDTGGLNIKTGVGMRDMKKDMGGAAHALGLAWIIMSLNLPIQLRVLLPIAENSVSGNSYRPGDIITSRKNITVEIDDTDAEGRLVLADALAYACEDSPELIIDFSTLTGSARVAVGYEIPAFFTNRDKYIDNLRHSSLKNDDFIWPFPLWSGYDSNIDGNVSDLISVGSGRAGHIEAALFLQRFITPDTDWIHLDCFAWERNGKLGRTKGGTDTGLRAITEFIKEKYA